MQLYAYVARHPDVDPAEGDDTYHWFSTIEAMETFIEEYSSPFRYFVLGATREVLSDDAEKPSSAVEWIMCDRNSNAHRGSLEDFQAWLDDAPEDDPSKYATHPIVGDPYEIALVTLYVARAPGTSGGWLLIDRREMNPSKPTPYSGRIILSELDFVESYHVDQGLPAGTVIRSKRDEKIYILRGDETLISEDGDVYKWKDWPRPLEVIKMGAAK